MPQTPTHQSFFWKGESPDMPPSPMQSSWPNPKFGTGDVTPTPTQPCMEGEIPPTILGTPSWSESLYLGGAFMSSFVEKLFCAPTGKKQVKTMLHYLGRTR